MIVIMRLTESPFTALSVCVGIKEEYSLPHDTCLDQNTCKKTVGNQGLYDICFRLEE